MKGRKFIEPFNNNRTLKFKAQSTNVFFATVNQMFGCGLLPASDYCRARGNQIVEHSSDNKTVLDRSLNFRVRMLLKGAVKAGAI